MTDIFKNDKPVYFDAEKRMLYWIEWEETGNNDIPHRHYIALPQQTIPDIPDIPDIPAIPPIKWPPNRLIKEEDECSSYVCGKCGSSLHRKKWRIFKTDGCIQPKCPNYYDKTRES
jgi:hypothetical protein